MLASGPLLAAVLAIGACAPSTAPANDTGDQKTGALRVWLFDEAGRAPKEALVNAAVAEFTAAHKGVTVEVSYLATDAATRRRADRVRDLLTTPLVGPDGLAEQFPRPAREGVPAPDEA